MKKILVVLLIILTLFIIVGCGAGNTKKQEASKDATENSQNITIKFGYVVQYNPDHPYTYVAEKFANLIKEKSHGRIKVELFPGGQLGGDRDMFEALQLGTLDAGCISTPVVAGFSNSLIGLDLPWLFDGNLDFMYEILSGPMGEKLAKRVEEDTKVKLLAFSYQPFRHFWSKKPLKSVDELKGLKFRVMETPVQVDTFSALGTAPTPLPYGDIYTAMQMGTIDAFECDVMGVYTSKFYEVSKYMTNSGHTNNVPALFMSLKKWESLSSEDQNIVLDAAKEATQATKDFSKTITDKYIEKLKSEGVTFGEFNDANKLKELTKGVYDKYMQKDPIIKELVEEVQKLK